MNDVDLLAKQKGSGVVLAMPSLSLFLKFMLEEVTTLRRYNFGREDLSCNPSPFASLTPSSLGNDERHLLFFQSPSDFYHINFKQKTSSGRHKYSRNTKIETSPRE